MLVMSRQVGESISIGDSMVLTLAVADRDFADFHLVAGNLQPKRILLTSNRLESIAEGVTGILIGAKAPNGVRIGLEFPREIPVNRIDH